MSIMAQFGMFNVRIVEKGDVYGLNDCLTYKETEPLVEFYDIRFINDKDWKRGQFISRYCVSTLLETGHYPQGLSLMGYEPSLNVPAESMTEIIKWLKESTPRWKPDDDLCPECGSGDIQVIDRIFDEECREYGNRCICWACNHDWHVTEEQ
ncbi:MAG: hypothetical protein PHE93_06465 [Clostridia bacterium]|nr:hypothetical protein [Clostridia bacterium]